MTALGTRVRLRVQPNRRCKESSSTCSNGSARSTTKFVSGKTVVTNQWKDVGDATSNVHGEFWFDRLSPGQYLVVEQKNADWVQTTDQVKDPNAVVIPNKQIGVDQSLERSRSSRQP